jgi:hypothetical protein
MRCTETERVACMASVSIAVLGVAFMVGGIAAVALDSHLPKPEKGFYFIPFVGYVSALALGGTCFVIGAWLTAVSGIVVRQLRRATRGACLRCGHLRSGELDRCPECGRDYPTQA